jgi:large subunit ribosomal protein L29
MPNSKEIRDSSNQELQERLKQERIELFRLRNEYELSKRIEQPHRLRVKRREIARILTILRERELNEIQGGTNV